MDNLRSEGWEETVLILGWRNVVYYRKQSMCRYEKFKRLKKVQKLDLTILIQDQYLYYKILDAVLVSEAFFRVHNLTPSST